MLSVNLTFRRLTAHNVHPTHRLGYYRGFHFCWSCGAYTAWRNVKLKAECSRHPTPEGRAALAKLRCGELPGHVVSWPLDGISDNLASSGLYVDEPA